MNAKLTWHEMIAIQIISSFILDQYRGGISTYECYEEVTTFLVDIRHHCSFKDLSF